MSRINSRMGVKGTVEGNIWTITEFICPQFSCNFTIKEPIDAFRDMCIDTNEVICDSQTLNAFGENKTLSIIWKDLTNNEKKQIGIKLHGYLLNNIFYKRSITSMCEGPTNCVGGCPTYGSAVCVQNALIRVLRFVEPNESFSKCYYKNALGEEVCYYYPESYCLPCYPVTVVSVPNSFYHSIACLQIGTDVNNFNNWLFFQYNASDIVPGSWDMPLPCSVVVDNLVNGICAGYGNGVSIAKWNIDENGVIT